MRSTVFAALLAAALVLVSPAAARSEAPAGAEPVLTSAAEALGMKNISQLKGVHASGKITIYGLSGTADMWFTATQPASAIYTHLGALSQDQGFDGSVAWTRDTKGVVYVGGSASDHSGALNDAFRSAYDLWKPGHGGATVSLGDRKSEGGHDFDVVRVEVPGSTVPFDVWIDAASHLPARVVETDGPQVTTTNYSDYRPVHGVLYPFAVHSNSQGNDTAFAIENVEANPGGLAEHLRKPVSD